MAAELSGPGLACATLTPSTVNVFVVKLELKLPLPAVSAGTFPVTVMSVSASAPAAAVTCCCPDTAASWAAVSVPYWVFCSSLSLILAPAASWPLRTCLICCWKPNVRLVPDPCFGGWVTVRSVPTPYSEFRTDTCAFCTPAAAEVTVITSPIPSASPSATNTAWRMRRRSSRRRYIQNTAAPLRGTTARNRYPGIKE